MTQGRKRKSLFGKDLLFTIERTLKFYSLTEFWFRLRLLQWSEKQSGSQKWFLTDLFTVLSQMSWRTHIFCRIPSLLKNPLLLLAPAPPTHLTHPLLWNCCLPIFPKQFPPISCPFSSFWITKVQRRDPAAAQKWSSSHWTLCGEWRRGIWIICKTRSL